MLTSHASSDNLASQQPVLPKQKYGSLIARSIGYVIDLIILIFLAEVCCILFNWAMMSLVFSQSIFVPVLIFLLIGLMGLTSIFYFLLMPISNYQATLGMRLTRVHIVNKEGKSIRFWQTILRFLIALPLLVPILYFILIPGIIYGSEQLISLDNPIINNLTSIMMRSHLLTYAIFTLDKSPNIIDFAQSSDQLIQHMLFGLPSLSLLCISFFFPKKQTLYDMFSECYVVEGSVTRQRNHATQFYLHLPCAGFFSRCFAWLLDLTIFTFLCKGAFHAIKKAMETSNANLSQNIFSLVGVPFTLYEVVYMSTIFACFILYYVAFTASHSRAPLGKRLLGLYVVDKFGDQAGFFRILWRYVVLLLTFPLFPITLFTRYHRSLHDYASDTYVVCGQPSQDRAAG